MILTSRLFSLAVLRLTDRRELGTGSGSWAAASANGAIVVGDSRILPVRWTTPARAWRRGFVLGTSQSSERLMQAYSFSVRAGVLTVKPGLRLSLHTATFMAEKSFDVGKHVVCSTLIQYILKYVRYFLIADVLLLFQPPSAGADEPKRSIFARMPRMGRRQQKSSLTELLLGVLVRGCAEKVLQRVVQQNSWR